MTRLPWGAAAGAVMQVTKSNFPRALEQIKGHIQQSDYIAVSSRKTGGAARPWHRVLPIDTSHTAYLKAKLAAETYELLQFAVCPFRIDGSKVVAFPYNFHLFPRDELNIGMPSYSFSCQTSFLGSMAREGFDFNACIYEGLSYLSRVQESKARDWNTVPSSCQMRTNSNMSPADAVFIERTKSRVKHWKEVCKGPGKAGDDALFTSLRKLILGSEYYGSRPSLRIDICSSRQVQLVMQALHQWFDHIVPVVIPDSSGGPKAVLAVLTRSEEDKNLLVNELQSEEEERNNKLRGFREVIDLMSSSHKPLVAYDCLHDFSFIHSKFLAPLPQSMPEFMCSLKMVFPNILDVNHLMKEISPLRKANSLPAAISYLRRQFFVPLDMEVSQDNGDLCRNHGHNVLKITHFFAKLWSILNVAPANSPEFELRTSSVEDYANIFCPSSRGVHELKEDDVGFWSNNMRKVSINDLVFLWGFRKGTSAATLKALLHGTHESFSEDFELRLIDKNCAVVFFSQSGGSIALLNDMNSGKGSSALMDLISDGLKAISYEGYKRVCASGLWDAELADSLEKSLVDHLIVDLRKDTSDIYWPSDLIMSLNEL